MAFVTYCCNFGKCKVFFDHDEGLGNDFKLFFNSGEACCRAVYPLQCTLLKGSFRNFFNKFIQIQLARIR